MSTKSQRLSLSKAEEGASNSEDFDLDQFLHGISKAQDENGHKRKHLGVAWRNLHVEVRRQFVDLSFIETKHVI